MVKVNLGFCKECNQNINKDKSINWKKMKTNWKPDSLAKGATFSFTFDKPGTYTYICSIHPTMKGTVIVK